MDGQPLAQIGGDGVTITDRLLDAAGYEIEYLFELHTGGRHVKKRSESISKG